MAHIDEKIRMGILRCLRDADTAIGSAHLARDLEALGFDVSARTVRVYLTEMEHEGLVEHARRGRNGGRSITPRGITEIEDSMISERVGFIEARVDALSWEMDFDLRLRSGRVVLNNTILPAGMLRRALRELVPVLSAGLGMGHYATLFGAGERVGDTKVPPGNVAIGTVCSITVNGVLLGHRIPTVSRFGGVLELRNHQPERFTDVIYYSGTSLDPLEVFIKAGLTDVRGVLMRNQGRIGASFREIPTSALEEVVRVKDNLEADGLGGILTVGNPNQPLLGFPVGEGRTGLIVAGGLNPVAAIEEAGISTRSRAFSTLHDFADLTHYRDLEARAEKLLSTGESLDSITT